jgi:cell division protein FtsB
MSTIRSTARDGFVRGGQPGNLAAQRWVFLLAAIGLAVLALIVQFGENGIFALRDLERRAERLRAEVAALEAEATRLGGQLEALDRDSELLERIAREQHNMRRPDEEVLTVLPAPQTER